MSKRSGESPSPPADNARARGKRATHAHIVATAAAALRRDGFAGSGVAEIMGEAGLTHGGFYAHFASKEALLAEAADQAGADGIEQLARIAAAAPEGEGLAALVAAYLSDRHVVRPTRGCVIAAAGSEMPRQGPGVRRAATERIKEMADLLERQGTRWGTTAGHGDALAALSCLVGALIIARAVDEPALSAAVREAARHAVLAPVIGRRDPSKLA